MAKSPGVVHDANGFSLGVRWPMTRRQAKSDKEPGARQAEVWRRRPRQQRSANTVSTILLAAEELFAAKGYQSTTSEDIVRRAGFGIGSLYDYFPNKASIALALLENRSTVIADNARKIFVEHGHEPIGVSLPRVIRAIFQSYRSNRGVFITLVGDVPELRTMAELYSIDRLIHRASLLYLQMYQNEFPHHDMRVAHEFLNILFVSSIRHFLSTTSHQLDESTFLDELTHTILLYLHTPPASGTKRGERATTRSRRRPPA